MIKVITKTTAERNEDFEEKFKLYKHLFFNTTLTIPEILKELDLSENNEITRRIKKIWRKEGYNASKRARLIATNRWIDNDE